MLYEVITLLLIGRAQVGLGRLVEAKETFLKLSREEIAASAPAAFKRAQEGAKDEIAAIEPNRITSYNVCYTKLLRTRTNSTSRPRPNVNRGRRSRCSHW